jgi:hypothetical protein
MILIPLREKYRTQKPLGRGGIYSPRTGRKTKIGYKKHLLRGNTMVPKYERIKT